MTPRKGKVVFRRYRILTALVLINILASGSITDGYPATTGDTSYDEYYLQDVGEYMERLEHVLGHHKKHYRLHHKKKGKERS